MWLQILVQILEKYRFKKWEILKDVRKVITGALEVKRAEKLIRSSLEASINIYLSIL